MNYGHITSLLKNNRLWAKKSFKNLSRGQTPDYLWIGCSDSRVSANQITNSPLGEIFVHRNIANMVHPKDNNIMSVIYYAINTLKVKNIIVCGHKYCGGVLAAFGPKLDEPLNSWIKPIKILKNKYKDKMKNMSKDDAWTFLCEENIKQQVKNISKLSVFKNASHKITIYGICYHINTGLIKDLHCAVSN